MAGNRAIRLHTDLKLAPFWCSDDFDLVAFVIWFAVIKLPAVCCQKLFKKDIISYFCPNPFNIHRKKER